MPSFWSSVANSAWNTRRSNKSPSRNVVSKLRLTASFTARVASAQVAKVGEQIGLSFEAPKLTLFDDATGAALVSELNEKVLAHG